MKHDNTVRKYFTKLGLSRELADIYIALKMNGPLTISELARQSGVERTRIYRLFSELRRTGLIEVEARAKRDILKAAPLSNIEILLSKKEQELKGLKNEFTLIEKLLDNDQMQSSATRVQFYEGLEGAKQLFWNETKAHTEVFAIMYENMQLTTKSTFFERWVKRCNENDIHHFGIFGDHFIESQKKWYGRKSNERLTHWQGRYIPAEQFAITHRTVIYNDVVAYHNWKNGEIFGIEIYNQAIADTQRQFFEMLWQQATPMDDLSGKTKVQ